MKRVLAIGALACALTGCGTVQNFSSPSRPGPTVYGGVEIAAERFTPGSQNDGFALAFMWPAYVADVGASAVGDTLTLPITVALALWLFYHAEEVGTTTQNPWRQFWDHDQPPATPQAAQGSQAANP